MIEFKYDTQLLIEGENLKKEEISKHINKNLKGDCLIVVQVGWTRYCSAAGRTASG